MWILAAKLPNSDLNFALDFWVDFLLLFSYKEKGPKNPPKNPPQNSPGNSVGKIPLRFLQKPCLEKFPPSFPAKNQEKFTDELLQARRENL